MSECTRERHWLHNGDPCLRTEWVSSSQKTIACSRNSRNQAGSKLGEGNGMRTKAVLLASTLLGISAQAQQDTLVSQSHQTSIRSKQQVISNLPLNPRERAVQLLNRFTFGPRPGDVDRILAQGPDQWFEQQLTPDSIPDAALTTRLQDFPTLTLPPEQALLRFPDRSMVEQVDDGKRPYPTEPLLASVYEVQVYKLQQERAAKLASITPPDDAAAQNAKDAQKKLGQDAAARVAGQLFALPKAQRMAALNALPAPDRIAFVNFVPGDQRTILFNDFTPRERETILAFRGGVGAQNRTLDDLTQAKLLRIVLSERQLQEVMTDFWFNHFNVFAPKNSDQWYTTSYERDVIRPHALGKFRDLLLATAQSPAMMVYLDNWLSIGPNSLANGIDPAKPNAKPGKRGLNENYGREVMELHTLGVKGGYTQADVTALSAILTGWSVDRPHQGGPFIFDPRKHEPGPKRWLGYTIDEAGRVSGQTISPALAQVIAQADGQPGMKQGIAALILLAASPQTAHFLGFKLAQRFLADDPPPALVDRLASAYLASDGDIRTVLRTLIQSREFNSHRYFRTKVKTPEEFLASAFRATLTDPQDPGALAQRLNDMGQPLYRALPPTGFYVTADHWMNTQSLLARLNFADQLTHNRFANQKFDSSRVLALSLMTNRGAGSSEIPHARPVNLLHTAPTSTSGPEIALRVLEASLIEGEISSGTAHFIHSQLSQQPPANLIETLNLLTALLLGSPEFQLR